jgi:hypothetical protein
MRFRRGVQLRVERKREKPLGPAQSVYGIKEPEGDFSGDRGSDPVDLGKRFAVGPQNNLASAGHTAPKNKAKGNQKEGASVHRFTSMTIPHREN